MRDKTVTDKVGILGSLWILAVIILLASAGAHAQEDAIEPELIPLTDEESAALDKLQEKVESNRAVVAVLLDRLAGAEGLVRSITYVRIDRLTGELFKTVLEIARQAISLGNNGKDASKYSAQVEDDLAKLPGTAFAAMDRLGDRIRYESRDLAVVELVAADQLLFNGVRAIDDIFQLLFDYLAIADEMQIDADDVREKTSKDLFESAESRSVFLDMAILSATNLRASSTILPENQEIAAELRAADARVKSTAAALQRSVGLMQRLNLETRQYRQQVLSATGQITTDVLDVGVIADLVSRWYDSVLQLLIEQGPKLLLKLFLMILIIYLAVRISRLVQMGINHALDKSRVQISHLLRSMVVSTGRNLVIMLGILIALSQVGISLGPLLAGLGIAGFIVGFAMQDALSNFASGMLILFYRPFDVGDTVEAGGVRGQVKSMSLVNTTVMTFDNQALVIPNNLIWSTVIKNVTAQRTRRVDLTFGISYGDDIEKAERVFRDIVTKHEKVLNSPEPMIHLHELGDSSVNFIVRPWVRTEDYWDVYWDVTREVKIRLDAEGISIPFPQRDVHVYETKPA